MIDRVFFIPFGNEVIAALANEFAVEDRAAENAWDVEPVTKSEIRSIFDAERAIEEMFGSTA